MDKNTLLELELGKVGSSAGEIASAIGENIGVSVSSAMTSHGGSFGARMAAKFLPTEQNEVQITIRSDPRTILSKAHDFICSNGRVIAADEGATSSLPTVSGVIGSGFLQKNPTILSLQVSVIAEDGCTVVISGAAKEGLIKQQSAAKAVDRLVTALRSI